MKKTLCTILIFLCFFVLFTPTVSLCDDIVNDDVFDIQAEILAASTSNSSEIVIPQTNSRACVVIDRNTNKILYGKNELQKRKMASTTKIMTATVIIENCNLTDTVEVSKKAAGTGGSRLGLKTSDKITIKDLLYGLMLCSGNDAAVALAEYAGGSIEGFSNLMNKKAGELGLSNTHFETPHGLDSDEHYTTAYELAILSNYALNNKTFAEIVSTKNYTVTINGYPKELSNTNELLGNLNGVYGVKTGFTNGANRCLVSSCKRDDIDIICVVLGADTKKFRTSDSIKLINYIFDNFKMVNLQDLVNNEFEQWKKQNLNTFNVNKGSSNNLSLEITPLEDIAIPIRKDLIDTIKVSINCNKDLEAPLQDNLEIGDINILINNEITYNMKVINKYKINKKSPLFYLKYFLEHMVDSWESI